MDTQRLSLVANANASSHSVGAGVHSLSRGGVTANMYLSTSASSEREGREKEGRGKADLISLEMPKRGAENS